MRLLQSDRCQFDRLDYMLCHPFFSKRPWVCAIALHDQIPNDNNQLGATEDQKEIRSSSGVGAVGRNPKFRIGVLQPVVENCGTDGFFCGVGGGALDVFQDDRRGEGSDGDPWVGVSFCCGDNPDIVDDGAWATGARRGGWAWTGGLGDMRECGVPEERISVTEYLLKY
jgi:hypothetical protein